MMHEETIRGRQWGDEARRAKQSEKVSNSKILKRQEYVTKEARESNKKEYLFGNL